VATLRLKTENPTHDHPSMIDSMCWAKFGDAGGLAYGSDEGYRK
jgi:hypothetical protein